MSRVGENYRTVDPMDFMPDQLDIAPVSERTRAHMELVFAVVQLRRSDQILSFPRRQSVLPC